MTGRSHLLVPTDAFSQIRCRVRRRATWPGAKCRAAAPTARASCAGCLLRRPGAAWSLLLGLRPPAAGALGLALADLRRRALCGFGFGLRLRLRLGSAAGSTRGGLGRRRGQPPALLAGRWPARRRPADPALARCPAAADCPSSIPAGCLALTPGTPSGNSSLRSPGSFFLSLRWKTSSLSMSKFSQPASTGASATSPANNTMRCMRRMDVFLSSCRRRRRSAPPALRRARACPAAFRRRSRSCRYSGARR